MVKKERQTSKIRDFLLKNITDKNIVAKTVQLFGISRAAVYKNINKLVQENLICHDNKPKNRMYSLTKQKYTYVYDIKDNLSESVVWSKDIKQHIPEKANVNNIWDYGFTEMFNNAIEHSQGKKITVVIEKDAVNTLIAIIDDGVGIFYNIQTKFNLLNEHEAILELSKGKLTTNKKKHSGEGIFFTSRAFDTFGIESHGIVFAHKTQSKNYEDVLFDKTKVKEHKGTIVLMQLSNDSNRILKDIFDEFAGDDYGFDKTVIPIELARYGDDALISRSQAKRVLNRINLFKHVIFDFNDVPSIGQAFADEIFRVFSDANPSVELEYINANDQVKAMINRAKMSNIDRI